MVQLIYEHLPILYTPPELIIHTSEHGVVIRDGFSVSPGHTLIIPKRHLASFFILSAEEKTDLMALLGTAKDQVEKEFKPTRYQ